MSTSNSNPATDLERTRPASRNRGRIRAALLAGLMGVSALGGAVALLAVHDLAPHAVEGRAVVEEQPAAHVHPRLEHEVLHLRHHSLFVPRDFDLSPYFLVVKPTLETGFDYRALTWGEAESEGE